MIKRSDVDVDNDEIRIINSKQHKSRIIVMSNEMTQLMRTYLTLRDVKYPESEYLFPNPDGGPYTAARMQGRLKRFFALSKPDIPKEMLPSIRVYDLRYPNHYKIQTFLSEVIFWGNLCEKRFGLNFTFSGFLNRRN